MPKRKSTPRLVKEAASRFEKLAFKEAKRITKSFAKDIKQIQKGSENFDDIKKEANDFIMTLKNIVDITKKTVLKEIKKHETK